MSDPRASRKPSFRHSCLRRLREESGFAIVEVMVSAVLLVVVATATFNLIDQSADQSASNRFRGVAVSLAEQDQDRLRAIPFTELGDTNQTSSKTIRGITYTIASNAQYANDSTGVIPCSDGSAVQYVQIATTVTWPNMGTVQPVEIDSLVTPNVGNIKTQPNLGNLVVVVKKENGTGQPDIPVTVGGVTKTTDATGCARWSNLAEAFYTVSGGKLGYLTRGGASSFSESVAVVKQKTSTASYTYDQVAGVVASIKLSDGTAKKWRSATIASSSTMATLPAAASTPSNAQYAFTDLYPFTGGYRAYAGRCAGNDPKTYLPGFYAGAFASGEALVTPGVPDNQVTAFVRSVRLQVTKTTSPGGGNALSSGQLRLRISPNGMSGSCETVARQQVGLLGSTTEFPATAQNFGATTDGNGTPRNTVILDVPLPYGIWDICVDNSNSRRKTLVAYRNTPDGGSTTPDDVVTPIIDLGVITPANVASTPRSGTVPQISYSASNC